MHTYAHAGENNNCEERAFRKRGKGIFIIGRRGNVGCLEKDLGRIVAFLGCLDTGIGVTN